MGHIQKCIINHSGRYDKSHLYEHAKKTGHEIMNKDHFEILSNSYKNKNIKRKLVEALHIKYERPTVNVQEQSVPLTLFLFFVDDARKSN